MKKILLLLVKTMIAASALLFVSMIPGQNKKIKKMNKKFCLCLQAMTKRRYGRINRILSGRSITPVGGIA